MADKPHIGSTVWFRYKGGVKGEEPVDDHSTGEPFRVMLGTLSIPRGVELALMEMEKGEQKTVDIPPELGYGQYQSKQADWHTRAMIPRGYEAKTGDILYWVNPEDGKRLPVWVADETQDAILLDFNHPFAGRTLTYWLELVDFE